MPLPKPNKDETRSRFISRCMSNNTMVEEYTNQDQRMAVCQSQWENRNSNCGVIGNRVAGHYTPGRRTHNGKEYLVVSATLLVEGVHCGSAGCFQYPTDVLQNTVNLWNGTPVIYDHPKDESGQYIVCDDPRVANQDILGAVYNPRFENNSLKADVWFESTQLQQADPRLYQRVLNGELIELSTGMRRIFVDDSPGNWNGEQYEATMQDYAADHLAIMPPGAVGACSIEDGCGVGNKEGKEVIKMDEQGTEAKPSLLERISKLFNKEDGKVHYNQEMDLTEQMRMVMEKLDSMDTDFRIHYLENMYDDFLIFRVENRSENKSTYYKAGYSINGNEVVIGDPVEVQKKVEFIETSNQTEDNQLAGNEVKLTGETNVQGGEVDMSKCDLVQGLIDNEKTYWKEEHRDVLNNFSEEHLKSLQPEQESVPEEAQPAESGAEEQANQTANQEADPTVESFLNSAPPQVRELLSNSLKTYEKRRGELISEISNAAGCNYTQEELTSKSLEDLENISGLIRSARPQESTFGNYVGNAGVQVMNADDGEEPLRIPTLEDVQQ